MTDTLSPLQQAQQEAEQAQVALAEAKRKADEAAQEHLEAVERRRAETARGVLDSYDDAVHEAEMREAQARLREEVLADPTYRAVYDVWVARLRAYHRAVAANGAAARLGIERHVPVRTPGGPEYVDLLRIISDAAGADAYDEQQALDEAREEYAQTGQRAPATDREPQRRTTKKGEGRDA